MVGCFFPPAPAATVSLEHNESRGAALLSLCVCVCGGGYSLLFPAAVSHGFFSVSGGHSSPCYQSDGGVQWRSRSQSHVQSAGHQCKPPSYFFFLPPNYFRATGLRVLSARSPRGCTSACLPHVRTCQPPVRLDQACTCSLLPPTLHTQVSPPPPPPPLQGPLTPNLHSQTVHLTVVMGGGG